LARAAVHLDELPTETRNQVKKALKADKDSLTRASVAVLLALDQNGLGVKQWLKVLELVKKMLKA
jgi:hypothetical protein